MMEIGYGIGVYSCNDRDTFIYGRDKNDNNSNSNSNKYFYCVMCI